MLLLLVDDDEAVRTGAAEELRRAGHTVHVAADLASARTDLERRRPEAVVVSLELLGKNPRERIRRLREATDRPLILAATPDRVRDAAGLVPEHATDYVLHPPGAAEIARRMAPVLEASVPSADAGGTPKAGFGDLEARSPIMKSLLDRMRRVAPMRSTVLIYGESGVGKELAARSVHFNSPRRDHPFVALNCAAIPASLIESELFGHERGAFTGAHTRTRGKFELAHRGTLFLDEIGEMAPDTQAKLLRVLEQREFMRIGGVRSIRVDVRVLAATNADLERRIEDGTFRQDLFYRLKVVTLNVPPLRHRREDIPSLVRLFVRQLARTNAITPKAIEPGAMSALIEYRWPGNVRELKNLLESLLVSVVGDRIRVEDLPAYVSGQRAVAPETELRPGKTLAAVERELIRRTLEHTGGNRTHAAELLEIGVRTLQRKILAYGLDIPPKRRRPRARVRFGAGRKKP